MAQICSDSIKEDRRPDAVSLPARRARNRSRTECNWAAGRGIRIVMEKRWVLSMLRHWFMRFLSYSAALLLLVIFNIKFLVSSESLRYKKPVGIHVPDNFPVLVISKQNSICRPVIVFYGKMEQYLGSNPLHSYAVPTGGTDEINRILAMDSSKLSQPEDKPKMYAIGEIKVVKMLPDSQVLQVNGTWDYDYVNIGWYEVKGDSIYPLYYQNYFGPGLVLRAIPRSILIAVFEIGAFVFTWYMISRIRINRHRDGPEHVRR